MNNEQNYKNHRRIHPAYHLVIGVMLLLNTIGSVIFLIRTFAEDTNRLPALLFLLVSFILIGLWWFARRFALIAQDRAIRAEETFRYFALNGKLPPDNLTINQLIALRFAPDEEFCELCDRAARENLKPDDIKKSVKNWRGDFHRI